MNKTEWLAEVQRLKSYFESIVLPKELQINEATISRNLQKTINVLLLRAGENAGNPVFKGYLVDLQEIETKLKSL